MNPRLLALLTVLLALGAAAPAAFADRADDLLIEACRNGAVSGKYSQSDFNKALGRIPADSDQYTDCRSTIRRAKLEALAGGSSSSGGGTGGASGGGGTGGSIAPALDPTTGKRADPLTGATDAEREAVQEAAKAGGAPLALARGSITPGRPASGAAAELPPALLALVVLLVLLAGGAAAWATTTRVRARRSP